jgi:excisionase family DNA binding protein
MNRNEFVQKPLTLKEAAAFLGLKPSYLYNLVHFGKLTAYKPGGKSWFSNRKTLNATHSERKNPLTLS